MAKRSNRWAFIVYPDDPRADGFLSFLEDDLKLCAAVSPLHDRDVKDDGTLKKPHYHVIVEYSSLKSMQQVLEQLSPLGIEYVEQVQNRSSYTRYLAHLDSPDKARYNPAEVRSVCGYDLDCLLRVTKTDKRAIRRDVMNLVRECNITELAELYDALESMDYPEEYFDFVVKSSYFLTSYLRSVRGMCKQREEFEELEG